MNETLKKLFEELRGASAQARWAVAAVAGLLVLVAGYSVVRAQNPHFVVLAADLDTQSFNSAVSALAASGIRYETSMGQPPYVIRVEESKKYEALNAIHLSGEFLGGERGISSGLSGSSTVLLGQTERAQRTQKRMWEEAEMQLERLNFVSKAKVNVSGTAPSPLARLKKDERLASVVLNLRGLAVPSPSETRALVGIVRGATGVDDERITIVDQHSNLIYDGKESGGSDSLMELEERYGEEKTASVQAMLDRTFGPGLTIVGVTGTWSQVREESISEVLDPGKKPQSSRLRTTEMPEWPQAIGGPAAVAANTQEGTNASPQTQLGSQMATTSEEETKYVFGSKTTHTISQPHKLERLSISLVVDASIADRLDDAEAIVKGFVGFDATRGDQLEKRSYELPSLERGDDGAPVIPTPEPAPEPANPTIQLVLEHALEVVSGLAFLFILLKSLKSARSGGTAEAAKGGGRPGQVMADGTVVPAGRGGGAGGSAAGGAGGTEVFDEEIDMDALARAHIEELLREEPEKVSALLSRWALAEDAYAGSGGKA